MTWTLTDSGLDPDALLRYVEEQIYTLPGTDRHRDLFTVLLTGSRALGTFAPGSDVDVDVLCPEAAYEPIQAASLAAGITKSCKAFWAPMGLQDDWHRYFGKDRGSPHFSLNTLEAVDRQFREYDDVAIWIWTNARIIADPNGQFQRILDGFGGYPRDVLVRKIKYRWLMCWYWGIDVYPHNHKSDDELIVAGAAILNSILEMMRVFFVVEGKPFPYTEKLPHCVGQTKLGAEFLPHLQHIVDITVGKAEPQMGCWERLDRACYLLLEDVKEPETMRMEQETTDAIIAAGVDPAWMADYFSNIDELLLGELGPPP